MLSQIEKIRRSSESHNCPDAVSAHRLARVKSKGTVYLVGAGPGDAGLLTLRGAELLRRADVMVYDLLVNPALLRLARADAEIISRGKRTEFSQEQINELLIAKAREGKTVVRLKGGDPYIFGRGGEEAKALAAAKIPFEVVPGVSSIVAAPNYAGIPLTHREHCSSFTVFTGHENPNDAKTNLRYEEIAKIPGTKVVLMGMEKLADWTKSLIAHGMPSATPVAVDPIRHARKTKIRGRHVGNASRNSRRRKKSFRLR